jgi:inorganic pyrophosphatase
MLPKIGEQISSCAQLTFSLFFQDVFHMVVEVPRWSNAKMEVSFTSDIRL